MSPRLHEKRVGAREAISRRSWIAPDKASPEIAIVATLVSIALLSCLLRLCTRGRLLRTFAFDDGLALVAGLCSIGVLVAFIGQLSSGVEKSWQATELSNDGAAGPWALALSLSHIIGISLAKLSGAFYLLRVFDRRYCRFIIYGLIALILPSALTWFGSTLLRCIPLAAAWRPQSPPGSHCMSWEASITFAVTNNVINTSTGLILALILLPIACSPSINLKTRVMIITIICIAFIACAAAMLQTKTLFSAWQTGSTTEEKPLKPHLHRTIELTTALLAINIPSLASLASTLCKTLCPNPRPLISSTRIHPRPPNHSSSLTTTHSHSSSQTVIHRPNTARLPTLTRFHDTESNLTFDIATLASRTRTSHTPSRTHTMRTRTTLGRHSRHASGWSQFSGFTYYGNEDEEGEAVTELEAVVGGLGLDKGGR